MSTLDVEKPPLPPNLPLHGPWPAVSVFGRRWPGPGRPASPATVIAIGAGAIVAALSMPALDRPGVGWLISAIAGTLALVAARAIRGRDPHPGTALRPLTHAADPVRYAWAAATVLLLGVGTLRSAGWLFVLCVLTAMLTGVLATTGAQTTRAVIVGAFMSIPAGFRSLPWLSRGLTAAPAGGGRQTARAVITAGVSLALLVVFGALFASADATFADLLSRVMPTVDAGTVVRWVFVFCVTTVLLGGAAYLRAAPPSLSGLDGAKARKVSRWEWAVPLGLLVALFAVFVAVQLTVLFGGSRHVLVTDDLTYADYARGGFWQLLVVTGLTLLVLAGAMRWAPRETGADRTLIRLILGALSVLTLVIVASALHRMVVYSDTYGLTRLRLLVALCEVWLGVTFLLVIVAGIRLRAAWLPRAVMGAGVLALLGLAVANPDALIAERNVARFEQTGRIDTEYLAELSADAVPELLKLPPAERNCATHRLYWDLSNDEADWRDWSYGRTTARDLLKGPAPEYGVSCWR